MRLMQSSSHTEAELCWEWRRLAWQEIISKSVKSNEIVYKLQNLCPANKTGFLFCSFNQEGLQTGINKRQSYQVHKNCLQKISIYGSHLGSNKPVGDPVVNMLLSMPLTHFLIDSKINSHVPNQDLSIVSPQWCHFVCYCFVMQIDKLYSLFHWALIFILYD